MKNEIVIWDDLKNFVVPLRLEEKSQLEENLKQEGCRDPLVVWKHNNSLVLIDGHNRFEICENYNLQYDIKIVNFEDLQEVKNWIINNQLGRRNLNPDQISYYRGLRYENFKKKRGGYENVESKGKDEFSTSELLAQEFKVSESTVKRDAKFAQGLEIVGRSNPNLKRKILSGEVKVKKGDIQTLANAKNYKDFVIVNESDLYNKARIIRNELFDEIEIDINKIQKEKIVKAQEILRKSEPIFQEKDDRLRKIKGMILSAINRAIVEKDTEAIHELKRLIDRLEKELFY